jgi:hypothetical protein
LEKKVNDIDKKFSKEIEILEKNGNVEYQKLNKSNKNHRMYHWYTRPCKERISGTDD